MDKFLEKYNLPKLNEEEAQSLNRTITADEVETVQVLNKGFCHPPKIYAFLLGSSSTPCLMKQGQSVWF